MIPRRNYAKLLEDMERPVEAAAAHRELLAMQRDILGDQHRNTLKSMSDLGAVYLQLDRLEEAEALLLEAYEAMKDHPNVVEVRKQETLERLIKLYEARGKPDEADAWRAQLPAEEIED